MFAMSLQLRCYLLKCAVSKLLRCIVFLSEKFGARMPCILGNREAKQNFTQLRPVISLLAQFVHRRSVIKADNYALVSRNSKYISRFIVISILDSISNSVQ